MRTFLNIYDLAKKKIAVLENAYSITETQELNKIYTLEFSMPATDTKNKYCQPFYYARYGDTGQLYRIIKSTSNETTTSTITYECEHVIATLVDKVMFGAVQYGGTKVKTSDVIKWLLSQQAEQNWTLGACDFDRQFEYLWEQENLLNALYSIPKEFAQAYKWTFDTSGSVWKVNLKAIDTSINPEFYIRAKRNLLSQGVTQTNTDICTRIYALGYGEGVNQLTLKDAKVTNAKTVKIDGKDVKINGTPDEANGEKYGNTYIEDLNATAQYGLIERVLIDRRYENATSLFAYAKTVLENMTVPSYTRTFNVIDLYPLTSSDIDNAEVGKIVRMTEDNSIAYITKTVRVLDNPGNLQIQLSTKPTDVASTIADLAERVRIESVYAQGATQLYQHSKDANATKDHGLIMSLYFPSEMKLINKVLLHLRIGPFRAYSKATDSAEQTVGTTASSEKKVTATASTKKSTQTSSSGGGSSSTNASTGSAGVSGSVTSASVWAGDTSVATTSGQGKVVGGGSTDSADGSSGSHTHGLPTWSVAVGPLNIGKWQFQHTHGVTLPSGFGSHSHTVSFSGHRHTVTIPAHKHSVTIPAHKHNVTLPAHSHEITPGIFEFGSPKSFTIYVNGVNRGTVKSTSYDKDITAWLLNEQQQIPRDTWIDVDIRPDSNAYVQSSVFIQGFVQSRGGGNY